MVGFQLAELIPVLVPVTTVDTPVRSGAGIAVATTVADGRDGARRVADVAGRVGRACRGSERGRDHGRGPGRRASALVGDGDDTERAAIVLELVEATCVPSDTLPVGALIDSAPAVSVKLAGVAAPAGRAVATPSVATRMARSKNFRIMSRPFVGGESKVGKEHASIALSALGCRCGRDELTVSPNRKGG